MISHVTGDARIGTKDPQAARASANEEHKKASLLRNLWHQ